MNKYFYDAKESLTQGAEKAQGVRLSFLILSLYNSFIVDIERCRYFRKRKSRSSESRRTKRNGEEAIVTNDGRDATKGTSVHLSI